MADRMTFTTVDRPVTEISQRLIRALEKTLRGNDAVRIEQGELTVRQMSRMAERLRHQGLASRQPYSVRSRYDRKEQALFVWAVEIKEVTPGAKPTAGADDVPDAE